MRDLVYRLYNGLKLIILGIFVGCAGLFSLLSVQRTAFECGESYVFYLNSLSSGAKIVRCPTALAPIGRFFLRSALTGESTVYPDGDAEEVLLRYGGELLFTEEAAGVVSYYCHSDLFGTGVALDGGEVNLHVAVRPDGSICVGTPLIFGGY